MLAAQDDSRVIERNTVAVEPSEGPLGSDAFSALPLPQPVKYVAGIIIRLLYI